MACSTCGSQPQNKLKINKDMDALDIAYHFFAKYSEDTFTSEALYAPEELNGVYIRHGLTWRIFKGFAKKVKLQPTTEAFMNMTEEDAKNIFKQSIWIPYECDKIAFKSIAIMTAYSISIMGDNALKCLYRAALELNKEAAQADGNIIETINACEERKLSRKFSQTKKQLYEKILRNNKRMATLIKYKAGIESEIFATCIKLFNL